MGVDSPVVTTLAILVGGSMLVTASITDLRQRRIPNRLTYTAVALCLVAAAVGSLSGHSASTTAGLVGGSAFGALLLIPHVVHPASMGLGDVKLALALGFVIGWSQGNVVSTVLAVGWTIAAASLLGLAGAAVAAMSRGDRLRSGQAVPFGPALSLATSLAVGLALV